MSKGEELMGSYADFQFWEQKTRNFGVASIHKLNLQGTRWGPGEINQCINLFYDELNRLELGSQKILIDLINQESDPTIWDKLLPAFELLEEYAEQVVIPHRYAVAEAYNALIMPSRQKLAHNYLEDHIIFHDVSKFTLLELIGYYLKFRAKDLQEDPQYKPIINKVWNLAWNHHQKNNLHHPEAWFMLEKGGIAFALDMPQLYVDEMVCDWVGAGKVYSGKHTIDDWFLGAYKKFLFTIGTVKRLSLTLKLNIGTIISSKTYNIWENEMIRAGML